jgi:tryptophan halogenase
MQIVNKITVLGGGSAGFMAALALKSRLPDVVVRIIRAKDIGIIGVGEGSTVGLTEFLHQYLKLSPKKFHEQAQPTWKLGLKFIWGPRSSFNYTFGPGLDARDPTLAKANGFYCDDDIACPDVFSALMSFDRAFVQEKGRPLFHNNVAYHFENEKFVGFLETWADALGVEIRDDKVATVEQDESGITGLVLASGEVETADLYVDCSGFGSVLLGQALREPFVSFRSSLFCERAIVGGWDRSAPEDELIKPYTTCETMNAGWAWQIEHENRINRGYVYAPGFITDEEAEREFRAKNPKVGPTRIVPFVSGRYERQWVKNVVAIGNAAGFVEPLEATALGIIAQQSRTLASSLVRADRQPRPSQAAAFNSFFERAWDDIRGFLALHYKFNTRLDTKFWRHCWEATDLAGAEPVVEYYEENGPDGFWGKTLLSNPHNQFGIGGYFTLLIGMKVPFRKTFKFTTADLAACRQRWDSYAGHARRGLTVRQTLAAIRAPGWRW